MSNERAMFIYPLMYVAVYLDSIYENWEFKTYFSTYFFNMHISLKIKFQEIIIFTGVRNTLLENSLTKNLN